MCDEQIRTLFRTGSRSLAALIYTAWLQAGSPTLALRPKPIEDCRIYPVPTSEKLYVEFNSGSPVTLAVFNAAGNAVISPRPGDRITSLDLSALPQGQYWLRVTTAAGSRAYPFVVIR
jgi:hypothetical protein